MEQQDEQADKTRDIGDTDTIQTPVILTATTREELATQLEELKSKHDGHTLTAGAVAHSKDNGTYLLRIDII